MHEQKQLRHVALILDGNRRFAKALQKPTSHGHTEGAKKVLEIVPHIFKQHVDEITLYVLSHENLNREKKEVQALLNIFSKFAKKLLQENPKVHIRFCGNMELFDENICQLMEKIESQSKGHKQTVNLAFGYGGRQELLHAMRTIGHKIKKGLIHPDDLTESTITSHLWIQSEPDLIIRTGQHKRSSNFLPWQSTYSEWFYSDLLWPQITTQDIDTIFAEFATRKRNFGK